MMRVRATLTAASSSPARRGRGGGTRDRSPVLTVQRAAGNRATQDALSVASLQRTCACGGGGPVCHCEDEDRGPPLQRKLAISTPGDAYEVEADRVAEDVMRMPDGAAAA